MLPDNHMLEYKVNRCKILYEQCKRNNYYFRSTAVCATRGCVAAASQDSTTSPLSPPILYRARRMIGLVLGAMVW